MVHLSNGKPAVWSSMAGFINRALPSYLSFTCSDTLLLIGMWRSVVGRDTSSAAIRSKYCSSSLSPDCREHRHVLPPDSIMHPLFFHAQFRCFFAHMTRAYTAETQNTNCDSQKSSNSGVWLTITILCSRKKLKRNKPSNKIMHLNHSKWNN